MLEKKPRKRSTWYALVRWEDGTVSVDTKHYVYGWYSEEIKRGKIAVLCDDQPRKVLDKMFDLTKESE
jgi:hypothetical protein